MNIETKDKITQLLIEDQMKSLNDSITQTLDDFKTSLEAKIDGVKAAAYADMQSVENLITHEKPLVVNLGTVEVPDKELVHSAFLKIIKILSSTKRKEKNIMLVGGAGGGKTHLVNSIAKALKLPFYPMSVGLQTTKSDLLGFINANGIYMPSPIRLAYENGGVLLLDEFDAAHAGVITILNSLLANGHCSFPDKIIQKHKDFVCLCACNTYGKGGTMDYVGRNRLDAATLDRFIIVDVNYDENLERELTKNEQWTEMIKQIRTSINNYGIKMIVSPRTSMDGADLLEGGFNIDEVLDMCIFKGCDNDIKTKILKDLKTLTAKFHRTSSPVAPELKYNVDILVDFDKKCHDVTLYECGLDHDKYFNFVLSDELELNLAMLHCGDYTPYLSNTILYLNLRGGELHDSSTVNTSEQIEKLLLAMRNLTNFYTGEDLIRLSVIHNKVKTSVCLNTGVVTEEGVKRKRKAK